MCKLSYRIHSASGDREVCFIGRKARDYCKLLKAQGMTLYAGEHHYGVGVTVLYIAD